VSDPSARLPPAAASDRRLVTIALFVSTFLVSLDASVVSTAMPTVVGQIGGIDLYAWAFSAYLLTNTVSIPIYGKLSDLYGRKPVFLVSTAIFLVASALCGQAQSMEQLIAFRLLQGLGAGGVLPTTQTILGDIYPLAERARLTGLFSTIWGVSGLLGPAIGGFLTEHVSWRWVFYVNLPLSFLAIVLVWSFLHERVDHRRHAIDVIGAVSLSGAVGLFLLALQNPTQGNATQSTLLYVLALALLVVFIWQERRAPEPLVPLSIFRRRVIGLSVLISGLIGVVLYGQNAFVPPFVQGAMANPPTIAGFVLAMASISWPIGSTIGGRALLRWGYRAPCVIGCGILTLGFVGMGVLPPTATLLVPLAIEFLLGPGFGLSLNLTTLATQDAVGWEQRGMVTGVNQFARNIGGILGLSVSGAIFSAGVSAVSSRGIDPNQLLTPSGSSVPAAELPFVEGVLAGSLHAVFLLMAASALLAGLAAALLPPGRLGGPRSASADEMAPSEPELALTH
jgi:EmrB/QacA subfamily drug resistance transporter